MSQALIISEFHFLEFEEIRMNVVRVPEVLLRLRTAQDLWSRYGLPELDLQNHLVSEDKTFFADGKIKTLLSFVVMMGFYDRYIAKNKRPNSIIFDDKSKSLVRCMLGEEGFESYLTDLMFEIKSNPKKIPVNRISTPKYSAIQGSSDKKMIKSVSLEKAVSIVNEGLEQKEFTFNGPSLLKDHLKLRFALKDLVFSDSVQVDPKLNWFWGEMTSLSQAEAVC